MSAPATRYQAKKRRNEKGLVRFDPFTAPNSKRVCRSDELDTFVRAFYASNIKKLNEQGITHADVSAVLMAMKSSRNEAEVYVLTALTILGAIKEYAFEHLADLSPSTNKIVLDRILEAFEVICNM